MFRKPQHIILVIVVLLMLVILNLPSGTANRLKLAIGSLFVPLFGLTRSAQQTTGHAADTLVPRGQLIAQNEQLNRENQRLKLELVQGQQAAQENARFRQHLNWQARAPWKLKLAKVALRDPANWWRSVQIDLGSRDGIKANFPVLTPDGLVGRVSSVSLTRSQVALVGDPNCRVSALVENESRDHGVVLNSSSSLDNSLVTLGYLPRGAVLKPGQKVVTSGIGSVFKQKGVPIGTVVDFEQTGYGLQTEARVKLAANLSSLEEVWVLCE
jgi:rod shape-determining protein MreC